MEKLLQELNSLDEIKAVKRFSGPVLKIQLFTHEIKGSEAVKVRGDLKSISQKLVNALNDARERGDIQGWNWVEKPEKKYQETNLGYDSSVTNRKDKGHKTGYYQVSVEG